VYATIEKYPDGREYLFFEQPSIYKDRASNGYSFNAVKEDSGDTKSKEYKELKNQLLTAIDEHGRNCVEVWYDEETDEYYARYYDASGGEAREEITGRINGSNLTADEVVVLTNELRIAYFI